MSKCEKYDPFKGCENLVPCDGEVFHLQSFLTEQFADELMGTIVAGTPWRQEPIKIFGREVLQPRLTAWLGDPGALYKYSGLLHEPLPWTQPISEIKSHLKQTCGLDFNGALVNYYRDGRDSMGWHRDNERELGAEPTIASVSLGETRLFKMRHYFNKKLAKNIELRRGDLLVMKGLTQNYWEHSLPKTARPKGARVNITFRLVDIQLARV